MVVLLASEFDEAPASELTDCPRVGCVDEDEDSKTSRFKECMRKVQIETYLSISPTPASANRVNGLVGD